jgi:hypothetical protein
MQRAATVVLDTGFRVLGLGFQGLENMYPKVAVFLTI